MRLPGLHIVQQFACILGYVFAGVYDRVRIVAYWVRGRRNGIGAMELIGRVVARSAKHRAKRIAKRRIRRLGVTSGTRVGELYHVVHLHETERPLYWPCELGLDCLYMTVNECCCRDHWHYYETSETRVHPEDVVLDCGAAEGLFSLQVQPRCKRVFCVEPLPMFVRSLQMTFDSCRNVTIVPVALSDVEEEARLYQNGAASCITACSREGSFDIPIKVTTIDSLFGNTPVTYIKADVEGSELQLLRGAEQTIRRWRPKIAIAAYHSSADAELLSKFLTELNLGYKVLLRGICPEAGKPIMLHAWVD